MRYVTVLTIAGSDCSGGAGIQADIKTISALGCYAASAITAVTVQNTCGVKAIQNLAPEIVRGQMTAISDDIQIDAIKIGMVSEPYIINEISEFITTIPHIPVVFDPVLVSTSGHSLVAPEAIELIKSKLLPLCSLLTPNLREAETLTGINIKNETDMVAAGKELLHMGCQAVLVKGGHMEGDVMTDILVTSLANDTLHKFTAQKVTSHNTHGTGCTLSSAIAAHIAQGYDLVTSIEKSKSFLTQALNSGKDIALGKGHGPVNHFFAPVKMNIK